MTEDPDDTRTDEARRLSESRIARGFEDAKSAAKFFGWNYTTYSQHERGERGLRKDTADRYAKAYHVSAAWLLTGEGTKKPSGIRLVGHVGADARPDVVVFTTGQGIFDYDVPVPPGASPSTVAVEVRGNSMRQIAKDGWKIYYDEAEVKVGPLALDALYGELCICWLVDGRVLFKELHPGKRPGFFFLSSTNDDPMPDEMVERAARVTFIAPKGPRPATDRLTKDETSRRDVRRA